MIALFVAATAGAVAALLVAERRGTRWRRPLKMLASTGFVAVALAAGADGSGYGRLVLAALALSWLGDLALTLQGRRAFVAGLVAFLLAHVAYVIGFSVRGVSSEAAMIAGVTVAIVAVGVWRWLRPHLEGALIGPVAAYVVVISVMVALAWGTAWSDPGGRIAAGAIAFFLSDLAVARDRFVLAGFVNRAWGLPAYYLGQVLLAWSVVGGVA